MKSKKPKLEVSPEDDKTIGRRKEEKITVEDEVIVIRSDDESEEVIIMSETPVFPKNVQ